MSPPSPLIAFLKQHEGVIILILAVIIMAAIIGLYFASNSLKHSRWFITRRFINWFPMGMTYAFLYMGRYNINVSKNALGSLMSTEDFGMIVFVGTLVYGLSFLVNGPLVDKIGGKKGIIIAAVGSAGANIILGICTYLMLTNRLNVKPVLAFSIIYGFNMYFQSYGAVSIIKVKAYWFHVRERGVFSAIFGTLISFGVYFAFDWGQAFADLAKAKPGGGPDWLHRLVRSVFAIDGSPIDAIWAVFFIPAAILLFWIILDWWLVKDTPEEANFPHLDTHDASSGVMHIELSTMDLLKKVFASRLMLLVAAVGLTVGVVRNGIMQWYFVFAKEVPQPGAGFFHDNWGFLLCVFGIIGGFSGMISDRYFQSRRGPPVAICFGLMLLLTIVMTASLYSSPILVGAACVLITAAAIGVHALMSGTAAADFGGRKATATCAGIVDGFVYLGGAIQSLCVSRMVGHSWIWWPLFLIPFTIIGGLIAIKIWHELPAATRKYIDEVERKARLEFVPD